MALPNYFTPFMGSVSVTITPNNVWNLLSPIFTNLPHKACFLQIQSDTTNGSTSLYVGNSNVASNMCGANLSANQAQQIFAFDSNLGVLDHIYLMSNNEAAPIQVNITVVVR